MLKSLPYLQSTAFSGNRAALFNELVRVRVIKRPIHSWLADQEVTCSEYPASPCP